MPTYKVAEGRSLAHFDHSKNKRVMIEGGTIVPDAVIDHLKKRREIVPLIRDRFIVQVGRPEDDLPENPNGALPALETTGKGKSKSDQPAREIGKDSASLKSAPIPAPVPIDPKGATKTQVVVEKPKPAVGLWNLDPKLIAAKPLDELNTMVLERDPKCAPFETVEEARAQLSLDFQK